jgi:hypothetical protein
MDPPSSSAVAYRPAVAAIRLRAGLRIVVLVFGLLAEYRAAPSHEDSAASLWWFLQDLDSWFTGWLAGLLGGALGDSALGDSVPAALGAIILFAGYLGLTVLYGRLGTRIGRGSRSARRVVLVWTSLGVLELALFFWLIPPVAGDASVRPLGAGPVADLVNPVLRWAWPAGLLALDLVILALLLWPSIRRSAIRGARTVGARTADPAMVRSASAGSGGEDG